MCSGKERGARERQYRAKIRIADNETNANIRGAHATVATDTAAAEGESMTFGE